MMIKRRQFISLIGGAACVEAIATAAARPFSPLAIRAFTPVFDGLWRRLG